MNTCCISKAIRNKLFLFYIATTKLGNTKEKINNYLICIKLDSYLFLYHSA